jgi:cyclophilin family peptidyl-prolyl cis-trans isomerase
MVGAVLLGSWLAASVATAQTPGAKAAPGGNPIVVMKTSMGEVKIQLARDKAPVSVDNFLSYVKEKYYDGTVFHRIIPSFMIQGGGFTPDLTKKPTKAPIKLEVGTGLKNIRGSVAMARTNDPNSATSQFFINVVDNPGLDSKGEGNGYAVFGQVIEGMDVVDKIKAVKTAARGGMNDVPEAAVVIESIRVQ